MVNAASITLLTPIAAMVGLAAGIPLLALSGRRRLLRARNVLSIGLLFLLLAGAASQPVVSHGRSIAARGDVEAYVLFDVSRSIEQGQIRATTFEALEGLVKENFFSAGSTKRAVVILTDGESRPFD